MTYSLKRLNFLILTLLIVQFAFSREQVDTISVYATKMKMEVKNVVIVPKDYSKKKRYPVVYMLHGFGGNYANYVTAAPVVKELATRYQMVLVCPDGRNSFYLDSPVDSTVSYESFIINDLVPYVDAHYSTKTDRRMRAIQGLSMGGHGAFYLALRHKELFGSIGSMSGCVDLNATSQKPTLAKYLGVKDEHPGEWNNRSAYNMVDSLKNGEYSLIIDCGTSDFFYEIAQKIHQKLLLMKIDHDYTERPGAHNWSYWRISVIYQLQFFDQCFKNVK